MRLKPVSLDVETRHAPKRPISVIGAHHLTAEGLATATMPSRSRAILYASAQGRRTLRSVDAVVVEAPSFCATHTARRKLEASSGWDPTGPDLLTDLRDIDYDAA